MTRGQRAMHGLLGAAIGCLQAITTLDLRRAAADRGPARRLRRPRHRPFSVRAEAASYGSRRYLVATVTGPTDGAASRERGIDRIRADRYDFAP